ncbi:MAG: sugar phosphate isomerase/epimerase family protein [Bryobacteraceae bacterium]
MQFGIHSLLFRETFLEKDLPLLDKCKRLGFDAVEIIPFDPDGFPAAKVKATSADLGLTINTGYGMPGQYNIISPDPAIRRDGIEFAERLIDLSNEAGAKILTGLIHCGWGYLTGKMPTADEWQWGVEGMREIAGYAQQTSRLLLGVEACNRFETHFINTAADAVRFVRDIGLSNVKVHLDTFHMIREENDIPAAVRAAGSYVGYVHACENQRGIPGTGMVPWVPFFEALQQIGYDGCVTIESFDPGLESVVKLCCIWRRLADSPEQLATEGLKFVKSVYKQVYLRETVPAN